MRTRIADLHHGSSVLPHCSSSRVCFARFSTVIAEPTLLSIISTRGSGPIPDAECDSLMLVTIFL